MYMMPVFSYDEICEIVGHKQPKLNCLDMATYGSYVRQPCDDDHWDRLEEEDDFINRYDLTAETCPHYHHTDEYLLVQYLRFFGFTDDILIAVDY